MQEVTDRLALCRRERLRERSGSHDNSWAESTRAERERGAVEGYLRVKGLLTNVTLSQ